MEQPKSLSRLSRESLILRQYVEAMPPGTLLEYSAVAAETGIPMTRINKNKLRSGILAVGKEYEVIRHIGYRLACRTNAIDVLSHRLASIDSRVKRADRTRTVIQSQFYDQLTVPEQRGVLFLGAVFGAIRVAAENGRKIYSREPRQITAGGTPIMPNTAGG